MAVYKVPQDIEAEDKLIGPFSFRQFVFILIMVGLLYLTYVFFSLTPFMAIIPLPGAVFFGVLGLWPRKDQPVEIYLAALIHFWTKPRKKVWSQGGQTEHVIITAPKKIAHQYTDGLENAEVKSRLHGLASTLDSRGWNAKNVPLNEAPVQAAPSQNDSTDRLVMPAIAPQQNQVITTVEEDVLDTNNNPVGQNFQHLVDESEAQRREAVMAQIKQAAASPAPTPAAIAQPEPQLNLPKIDYQPYPDMHQNTIQPSSQPQAQSQGVPQPTPNPEQGSGAGPSGAILNLANNSDLNISTLSRQADEALQSGDTIDLH